MIIVFPLMSPKTTDGSDQYDAMGILMRTFDLINLNYDSIIMTPSVFTNNYILIYVSLKTDW